MDYKLQYFKELSERTGLSLEEIDVFYLEYTKDNNTLFEYNNIEYIIKDIIEFKNESNRKESQRKCNVLIESQQIEQIEQVIPKRPTMITKLIYLWESRINK